MCIFHKWSRWEEYKWRGVFYPGLLSPKDIQGKPIKVEEAWQKRNCLNCGYMQRKEVTGY